MSINWNKSFTWSRFTVPQSNNAILLSVEKSIYLKFCWINSSWRRYPINSVSLFLKKIKLFSIIWTCGISEKDFTNGFKSSISEVFVSLSIFESTGHLMLRYVFGNESTAIFIVKCFSPGTLIFFMIISSVFTSCRITVASSWKSLWCSSILFNVAISKQSFISVINTKTNHRIRGKYFVFVHCLILSCNPYQLCPA